MTTSSRFRFRAWDKRRRRIVVPDDTRYGMALFLDGSYEISYNDDPLGPVGWTVEPSSNYILMQSTGLADRHGKEMFEDDIVDSEAETQTTIVGKRNLMRICHSVSFESYDIKWVQQTGLWLVSLDTVPANRFRNASGQHHTCDSLNAHYCSELTVVGNVHQDAGLLAPQPADPAKVEDTMYFTT